MYLRELSKAFFLLGEQMNSLRQWLAWKIGDREIFAYQVDNSFFIKNMNNFTIIKCLELMDRYLCWSTLWLHDILWYSKKKQFCAPFLWIEFNFLKAAEPLWGDSLLLTTLSSHQFLVLTWLTTKRWKAWSNLEPTSLFELKTPTLWIQCPNHYTVAPKSSSTSSTVNKNIEIL